MARIRREKVRQAAIQEIKDSARQLMAEQGTAGLSLRAIARRVDLTPSALYYYFDSLDALITALIVDAFSDLASTLELAGEAAPDSRYAERLTRVARALRDWALAHPVDFQLIYGNPIPGYQQPVEVTYPPARRSFAVTAGLIAGAIASGELDPLPEYVDLPQVFDEPLARLSLHQGHDLPPTALYLAAVAWARFHGFIMLELFNLIQPVIGDAAAFYDYEVHNMLMQMGFKP